jgi:hypothetical protein
MALIPPDIDNQQAQKEYFDALTESLKVLENRKGTNLFNVAAALFNPGRTGSFGEALGNAAGAMGADLERDEAKAPQIAQMRAALAGQKYETQRDASGMQMLSKALNVSPDKLQEGITAAMGDPSAMQRIMALTPYLRGKPLEMAKTLFNMNKDMQELVFKQMEAGVKPAEILLRVPGAEGILRSLNALPPGYKGTTGGGTTTPPTGAPSGTPSPTSAPTTAPTEAPPKLVRDSTGTVVDLDITAQPDPESSDTVTIDGQTFKRPKKEGTGEGQSLVPKETATQGVSTYKQFDGTPIDIKGIPPAEVIDYVKNQQRLYEDRVKLADTETAASYKKKMESVANLDAASLTRNNKDLNQVLKLLDDPDVQKYAGQMYKKGFVPGMLTAFDEVFKAGPISVQLPAYRVWLNSLPDAVQEKFRNIDRYLGVAYINAVSAKPFGGAPSNFEDIAIRNTIATARDPASVIRRFIEEQKITNNHLSNIRSGYDTFSSNKPRDMAPYKYFVTDAYKNFIKDYNTDYDALMTLRGSQ